ncbi:MAG: M42 family metallopeptidase [Anaerolineae bacterium]
MIELLEHVSAAYGPSGNESVIREAVQGEIAGLADDVRVDALGSLIAVRKPRGGSEGGRRVLIAAHMDEIGVIVTQIDERGFARFANVGYVNPNTLLGAHAVFANGCVGVFGAEGRPLPTEKPDAAQMFLDFGATSRADCPVGIGDVAVFRQAFTRLGQRVVGPNFDDRVGVTVLIQLLRELGDSPHTLVAVFSVQEEFGAMGAGPAAYGLEPDLAIALDVTPVGDTPKGKPETVRLGGGTAISIKDAGLITHPRVRRALQDAAERAGALCQLDIGYFGTTDAYAIQTTRAGIPSGVLSVPARYIHTPSQMVDVADMTATVATLRELLSAPIEL